MELTSLAQRLRDAMQKLAVSRIIVMTNGGIMALPNVKGAPKDPKLR